MMTNIVLVNQTTLPDFDPQVAAVVPILQTLFEQFESVWNTGLKVKVSSLETGVRALPDGWPIFLRDTTTIPGAGGFHIDDSDVPSGYVFVKDAMDAGESWTVDLSHEFLEMCSDPTTDVLIQLPGMPGYSCLREACDACEADQFGYEIDGVLVSDWCTPEYFYQKGWDALGSGTVSGAGVVARGLYDFMEHIKPPPDWDYSKPFGAPALLDGGYLGIQDPNGNWSQVSDFVDGVMSRRARRTMGRLNRVARRK